MSSGRRSLSNALVWALVPFILGAGLPQMQCRCAAAKGQRWSECCFQKRDESKRVESQSEKPCCHRRLAKLKGESLPTMRSASGGQMCQSVVCSKAGSCCELKITDAVTLSKQIDLPVADVTFIGRPVRERQVASIALRHDAWPGPLERSTFDRVVVFAHLLI